MVHFRRELDGQVKDRPDHHDAEIVIKLYDLRREAVMRESRSALNSKFWPKTFADVQALGKADHPLNAAFRQVVGYWEMVYGMARHGIVNPDFLVENNGEGLFLYARVEPFIEEYHRTVNPRHFSNAQWIARESEAARAMMEYFRARVARAMEGK